MNEFLSDKRINNEWKIIKMSDLPNDMPVLAVSVFTNKSMAEFHLFNQPKK
jgi:hypothetical protein